MNRAELVRNRLSPTTAVCIFLFSLQINDGILWIYSPKCSRQINAGLVRGPSLLAGLGDRRSLYEARPASRPLIHGTIQCRISF